MIFKTEILKLFSAPQGKSLSKRDQSNLYLTWQISLLLTFFLFLLAIFFSFFNISGAIQYSVGFIIACSTLIWTYYTKKGWPVSLFFIINSVILVSVSILFDRDSLHIVDPMWLICLILYGFITLGKKIGLFLVAYSSIIFSFYVIFLMEENLIKFIDSPERNMYTISIEISACIFIIGHFLNHFLKSINSAENKLIKTNKELEKQDQEKTVLLQEIHHRVKNNLQIIISLLRMQSNELESTEAKIAFQKTINRVMSMALIHQKMYEEKHLENINPKNYLKVLIQEMISNHDSNYKVELVVESNLEAMNLQSIVPFGLIATELVSNSLKHAFVKEGLISITINNNGDSTDVIYRDNGVWKEPTNNFSFGSELIETLVQQLDGKIIRTITDNGTTFQITI